MSKRAEEQALKAYPDFDSVTPIRRACYQEGYEQAEKDLGWHSVDESLPPVDEEVIVLIDDLNTAPICKIAFGHIVDRMHCSDYNGWNIPGVKYWMPMPKIPEK